MTDKVQDAETVVCRLCMSTEPGQIQIFEDGEKNRLCQKIKGCLSVQIHLKDTLTKSICQRCVAKVEEMYVFNQSCIHTQSILEKESLKLQITPEVTEAAMAEAESIVKRLQVGGSALSITPVDPVETTQGKDLDDVFDSPSALSITPVLHNSESSGDEDSQWDSTLPFAPLPHLKSPCAEDYILMQEETFRVDPSVQFTSKAGLPEYRFEHEDADVIETQATRRVVLPPMWDVYEKSADKENIIHRRYVVSKRSFACSLCGSCVAFHCKEIQTKRQDFQSEQNMQAVQIKQEKDNRAAGSHEQQILQDLRHSQSSSMHAGILNCPECGKLFPRRSSWKRHLRTHFEDRSFLCPLCGKGFSRKEHLSRHMTSHYGGRPFRCETCFKPFTRKEHLARHLACNPSCGKVAEGMLSTSDQLFSVPRPYNCDVCFQSFIRKEHLLRHQKRAHSMLDGRITHGLLPDEDNFKTYRCNFCNKSFPDKSKLHGHKRLFHPNVSPVHDDGNELGSPEQIEVEVSLVEEGSDVESLLEGSDRIQTAVSDEEADPSTAKQSSKPDIDHEEIELEKEDLVRCKINEAIFKEHEGSDSAVATASGFEVFQKSFTQNSLFVSHFSQFHPHFALSHAATQSVDSALSNTSASTEETQQPSSLLPAAPSRDDDDDEEEEEEADDESGSTQSSFLSDSTASSSRSKSGQHPCTICGKIFGRRYHLVRHRRTQHGVESVRTGPLGRPPKKPLDSFAVQPIHCSPCGGKFPSHTAYRSHSCKSNNNTISLRSGSRALAEMAAKISDKLHRSMDTADHACQSCGKSFCNKFELDKHLETHVNDLLEDMLWK